MKRILPLLLCFLVAYSEAQITTSTQWTWIKGNNTLDAPGVYGTQGIFDVANKPGARDGAISWTDVSGNFWLFGGSGFGVSRGLLNDLWKYDVASNRWAWMKGANDIDDEGEYGTMGVADPANRPGARNFSISWIDASGNLWLFGGEGLTPGNPVGFLNDLWKYSPSTNQWTWVSGDPNPDQSSEFGTIEVSDPGNKPGSRSGSVSWMDASGILWLFGGLSFDFPSPSYSNDLWKYDPVSGNWTWMKGNFILNQGGIYGTQTVANVMNNPGGRHDAGKWMDNSGNLWLFGGEGLDQSDNIGALNDLWKYNIASNNWTWMKGDVVSNQTGVYGPAGNENNTNLPGGRFRTVTWKDPTGIMWLYGGDGYGAAAQGLLSDLWKYNTANNQWTFMKGSNSPNLNSIYGTQGTSTATTRPGARRGGVSFTDPAGNLWLFGGNGYDASGGTDLLNDLWKLGSSALVPVKGLQLIASKNNNEVLLNWQTQQEINTEYFSIEKSHDGINYTSIGSKAAAGNSYIQRNYSFTDQSPIKPLNFYRIKLYEGQGYSYSNIVAVKMAALPLQLFPNPVKNILYVQAAITPGSVITIMDANGKKVKEQKLNDIGMISFSLDVSGLPRGMYLLLVKTANTTERQQFIKQ